MFQMPRGLRLANRPPKKNWERKRHAKNREVKNSFTNSSTLLIIVELKVIISSELSINFD